MEKKEKRKEVRDKIQNFSDMKQVAIKESKVKNNTPQKHISVDTRRHLILEAVAQGKTFNDILEMYGKEWNVGYRTMQQYVALAMKDIYNDETVETLRQLNLQRLDNIISAQIENEDYKNAIKSIDIQNKTANLYKEKVELETNDIEFTVKF